MEQNFHLELRGDHVHVALPPGYVASPDSLRQLWSALGGFCRDHDCWTALCEGQKPVLELDALAAHDAGVRLAEACRGIRLACCWGQFRPDNLTRHLENVSSNRGATLKFFVSLAEARRWLGLDGEVRAPRAGRV